ncbi:MAG: F0F1 ATP synthase subunit A [Candidatus Brocadiaceae bacterium]|nr:F0F1 ATP synthase subunit A [Candidatus Brocadiaceae bacterium]
MAASSLPLATLGGLELPQSAVTTWGVMLGLVVLGLVLRARLSERKPGRLQSVLEMLMEMLCNLTREIVRAEPGPYVPLVATLFVFVLVSNLLGMVPGLSSPTGDLSVTAALAAIVFFSVPVYGIRARGVGHYVKTYTEPSPFLLPLNLLSELTRTLALAIRLFGNIMSGEFLLLVVIGVVVAALRSYAHVFLVAVLPLTLFLSALSLIASVIQAYIFTVLALVYIGAAVERRTQTERAVDPEQEATA